MRPLRGSNGPPASTGRDRARYATGMAGFVSYLRVSTKRQGDSGLGLEAQRAAIKAHLTDADPLLAEYVEVESGKSNDRPELHKALAECRARDATLIVAKLDRLSRNAAFLLTLRDSGARFIAADMPGANPLTVGIMALVAEQEREAISKRTKEALQAARERGKTLGGYRGQKVDGSALAALSGASRAKAADARAHDLKQAIERARQAGATTNDAIAAYLNRDGFKAARGGPWSGKQVKRVLDRLEGSA